MYSSRFDCPDGWEAIDFSDAVTVVSTNKKKINQKQYLENGLYPVIDQGSSFIGGYSNDSDKVIKGNYPLIIFGDHTRCVKLIKSAFIAGADGVKVLEPKGFITPKLLEYFSHHLASCIKDKGYARHYQWLSKETIGIPPLNEQHRIVAKIEELFSELDKGIESLTTAKAQLQVYRQSLLKHAFEGKLTEQWRKDHQDELESSDELLACIQDEREASYQQQVADWQVAVKLWEENRKEENKPSKPKKVKRPNSITEEQLRNLPPLPKGWVWVTPQDICSDEPHSIGIGPFGSNLKVSDYTESGVPLVFVRNITKNNFTDNLHYITAEKYKELEAHSVKPLDILVTKMGDPPGDAEIYPAGKEKAILTADCLKFRVWPKFCSNLFYKHCINSVLIKKQLGFITKGVAQKKISVSRFNTVFFPMPSKEEQHEIASLVESKLEGINRFEVELEYNIKKSEALRKSILKKAFSGQLVPQDPDDEPASELLKRIAVEKAELEAQAKQEKAASRKPRKKTTAA
ncbi:restriction endonuclease subunit S [Oceanospirillum sediminis]|nr:restriction endonuclease subunit S [Oceanospirillum sediminis]